MIGAGFSINQTLSQLKLYHYRSMKPLVQSFHSLFRTELRMSEDFQVFKVQNQASLDIVKKPSLDSTTNYLGWRCVCRMSLCQQLQAILQCKYCSIWRLLDRFDLSCYATQPATGPECTNIISTWIFNILHQHWRDVTCSDHGRRYTFGVDYWT